MIAADSLDEVVKNWEPCVESRNHHFLYLILEVPQPLRTVCDYSRVSKTSFARQEVHNRKGSLKAATKRPVGRGVVLDLCIWDGNCMQVEKVAVSKASASSQ